MPRWQYLLARGSIEVPVRRYQNGVEVRDDPIVRWTLDPAELASLDPMDLVRALNTLGEEGWELVEHSTTISEQELLLRRQLPS